MVSLVNVTSYDSFIRMSFSAPILSYDEEQEYGRLSKNGDLAATQSLIISHLRLVVSTASKYLNWGIPKEDIIQEGVIGLMHAVKNFDYSNGARLSGFAIFHIKSTIQEFIRTNYDIVKVATTKAKKKIFNNFGYIKDKLSSGISRDDISKEYNVSVSDIIEMEKRLSGATLSINLDDGEYSEVIDGLTDGKDSIDVLSDRDNTLRIDSIYKALETLSPREHDIIQSRYLVDNKSTLEELSSAYGISKERIRQIEVSAISKLKSNIEVPYFAM